MKAFSGILSFSVQRHHLTGVRDGHVLFAFCPVVLYFPDFGKRGGM